MVVRYCIQHENYILSSILFQIPEAVIMWSRELYISLRSVNCTLPLAMTLTVYGFLHLFLNIYAFLHHAYSFIIECII